MCKKTGKSKVGTDNECSRKFEKTLYDFRIYYAVM